MAAVTPARDAAGYESFQVDGLDSLQHVKLVSFPTPRGGEVPLYGFETLTLAPIDRALIDPTLLTPAEIAWIDDYHRRVREALTPLVDGETQAWLEQATQPLRA